MWTHKCPKDMSKWKTRSAPDFFWHHSAESNVGSWQNALSVKIYKVDVRKIQNLRSHEKQVTKQQQKRSRKKRSRNSKVTYSCDQWTKIEVGNLIGLFGQIGDAMILSLPKRSIYHSQNSSSVHKDGIIFSGKSTYHTWKKRKLSVEKLYRKIVLCYLLLLEVYTHLFVGLHDDDDDEYWP